MNKKIGRNDPCFCGSNKKFKQCCGLHGRIIVSDNEWQKLRETEGKLIKDMLFPWVRREAPDLLLYAWDEFWFGEKTWPEHLYESVADQLFDAWFLFNWNPCIPKNMQHGDIEEGFPIALQYLQKKSHLLHEFDKKFIREICKTHFSFYVITGVVLGRTLTLKDIFLKSEITVKELQGSNVLKIGDIVFTRILSIDNQSICIGMMPMIIPSYYHVEFLDIREEIITEYGELNQEKLKNELEIPLREILFEFLEEILHPIPPRICNTDGDPLKFCTLSYSLEECIPEEACRILYPLSLKKTPDMFLNDAKRTKKTGEITKIEFPWVKLGNEKHPHWENTVLGHIIIERKKITVEVNSENRVQKARKEIEKRMCNKIRFLHVRKKNAKKEMEKIANEEENSFIDEQEIPKEILSKIEQQFQQYWINWLDQSLPILNGMTPREATATESGRERLEAVLLDFDCKNERISDANHLKIDTTWLRKQLNLK